MEMSRDHRISSVIGSNDVMDTPRGGSYLDRQLDREHGALPGVILRPHAPAVELDEVLHDGQAEAQPAVAARGAAVGLTEALEDVRQHIGRNPAARVADGEDRAVVLPTKPDEDIPARRRELEGVR